MAAASEVTREKRCCAPYLGRPRKGGRSEAREEEQGEGGLEARRHEGASLFREGEGKVEASEKEYHVGRK